jgi:hypothetical protein
MVTEQSRLGKDMATCSTLLFLLLHFGIVHSLFFYQCPSSIFNASTVRVEDIGETKSPMECAVKCLHHIHCIGFQWSTGSCLVAGNGVDPVTVSAPGSSVFLIDNYSDFLGEHDYCYSKSM